MKSPLTPITNGLVTFRSFEGQEKTDNTVTDVGYSAAQKDSTRRWIQNIHDVGTDTPVKGMHSKINSISTVSTVDDAVSPTEMGTVRGSTLHIPLDEEDPDQTMTALGLSNMFPAQAVSPTTVPNSPEQPKITAEPAKIQVASNSTPSKPLNTGHSIPRNDSGQDLEVRLDDGHLFNTVRLVSNTCVTRVVSHRFADHSA